MVPATRWCHVSTASNPADITFRGALARELLSSDLWWHGPPWLTASPCDWPLPPSKSIQDNDPEVKHISCPAAVEESWLIHRFSKYERLVRVVGWIKQFVDNCKTKVMDKRNLTCALSVCEFNCAEHTVFLQAQLRSFNKEIITLKGHQELSRTSPHSLQKPYLDGEGLQGVDGRLHHGH